MPNDLRSVSLIDKRDSLLVSEHGERSRAYENRFKRLLDIFLTVLALPAVMPVVLLCAALVSMNGGSPFYGQLRIGRDGKLFRMWKLRTMVPNAEAKLREYLKNNPTARREWDVKQKLSNDPRITAVGRILRRTSLDELPQLWNVLRGDMSLVGPRPMLVEQQDLYPGRAYYLMRPGLTGIWQVSERNGSSFSARATFDDIYYRELSLRTDLTIISKTVGAVLRSTGC